MSLNITTKELYKISLVFIIFISNSLIKKTLFSLILSIKELIKFYMFIKGGL